MASHLLRHLRSVAVRHGAKDERAGRHHPPPCAKAPVWWKFSQQYPDRYFDVAIAEQHAVTFAAGLAIADQKPVVAIYSSFLQRAYDQLIHDVALQNLPVLFAIDRAGLVGPTARPIRAFDISFLRTVPNMVVMTPVRRERVPPDALHRLPVQRASGGALPRGSGTGIQARERDAGPGARQGPDRASGQRVPPSWRSAPAATGQSGRRGWPRCHPGGHALRQTDG